MLVNKDQLHSGCIVLINLSNNEPGDRRITVNENLTLGALGLTTFEQAKAPDPAKLRDDMSAVTASTYLSPVEISTRINQLVTDFKSAQEKYAAEGGSPIQDRIAMATCDWLVAHRGFSKKDVGKDIPVVTPSDLQVTTVNTGAGLLFNVTGTSVWG